MAVMVRNDSGVAFNGPVNVAVLASRDAIADVGDVTVVQSAKSLKLKVGQSKVVKLKLPLASISAGAYQLLGIATMNDLTSSAAGPAMSVQTPVVHLVGAGSAPPGKPIVGGKKTTLAVPLRNDGNVSTTKTPATYTLIVSSDGTEAGGVYQTTATGKISLRPGQAKPQKVRLTFPAGTFAAGAYTIVVKVDAPLNDTNGQIVTTLPVTFV
jgi:hypothetical protein